MTKTKPLTTEQQQYVTGLVKQYPNPLGLVCTALIRGARVGKGAVYYAKEFGYDDEDIQQTAWQGAVEAARNFDPTRGADFSTYAAAVVARADEKVEAVRVEATKAKTEAAHAKAELSKKERALAEANARLRQVGEKPVDPDKTAPLIAPLLALTSFATEWRHADGA